MWLNFFYASFRPPWQSSSSCWCGWGQATLTTYSESFVSFSTNAGRMAVKAWVQDHVSSLQLVAGMSQRKKWKDAVLDGGGITPQENVQFLKMLP